MGGWEVLELLSPPIFFLHSLGEDATPNQLPAPLETQGRAGLDSRESVGAAGVGWAQGHEGWGFPCLPWRPKPRLGAWAGAEEVLPDSDGAQLLFPVVSGNTVPIINSSLFYVPEDLELGE